ncbi:MAG: PD40 domain-containing protein [Fimbriimonadaceae bacterium]|nr:PD40 domain-containing protein [Fimbriimonadaceae bacterium]
MKPKYLSLILVPALALSASSDARQLGDPKPKNILGARSISISPDGTRVAFSYLGDVWVVSSEGGRAVPVTTHIEMDDNPIWSPDGKWIAFSTNRNGADDIYVVPADGGESRRLTWFAGSDVASDWTPDGKQLLFRSTRDAQDNGLFSLDVRTGAFARFLIDQTTVRNPIMSNDGTMVAYNRNGFPWYRARYQGTGASALWLFDTTSKKARALRDNQFQHLWAGFNPDGKSLMTVTVSEKTPSASFLDKPIPKNVDNVNRTPNVYKIDLNGRTVRMTNFVGGGVRYLSVARNAGTAAFEYEGYVYTMTPGGEPKKIDIIASTDDKVNYQERLILTDGVSDAALNPASDKVAFTVRGEIWTVPVKKGKGPNANDATQLTDWAGSDQEPLWTPDGKSIFFTSDREDSDRLYRMDVATKAVTAVSAPGSDVSVVTLSPDKKSVYWWQTGTNGGLYGALVAGGAPKKITGSQSSVGTPYAWSPDGRYLAYSRQTGGTVINMAPPVNIWIFDSTTGKEINVTRLNAQHGDPLWSPDGRYLFFSSNRDGGSAIYALPLKAEDARETELELKYEKPKEAVKVDIDFDDIHRRMRRVISQSPQGNLRMNPENGTLYFRSEGDVWMASYDGSEVRRISQGGGLQSFEPNADYSQFLLVKGGNISLLNPKPPQFQVSQVEFRADWSRDVRKERQAAFSQFWRNFNSRFYDPNMHGRDWMALRKRYEPMLSSVGHRNEFATVLNMMVGELESSHSEVGPAPGNPQGENSAHPGFTIDYSYSGPGIKIAEVPRYAPGSYAKTKLGAGEYVMAINGTDVSANEALFRDVLNAQDGRDITLLVNKTPTKSGAREVKYRALSGGAWNGIQYRNRIEDRQKYVEEKSGGRIAYFHISGMGGNNFTTFNREAWEFIDGKKAAIIDVRNNGGGNIADSLVDMLERVPHSYYQARDQEAGLAPANSWNIPTVVMHAETSFSNAEMFPAAMKARKLATLVGVQTPGYVIWTYGLRLIDGTSARMPNSGSYRMDGSPMENLGQMPDVNVPLTYEDYLAGRDPQLDKAIEILLGKMD